MVKENTKIANTQAMQAHASELPKQYDQRANVSQNEPLYHQYIFAPQPGFLEHMDNVRKLMHAKWIEEQIEANIEKDETVQFGLDVAELAASDPTLAHVLPDSETLEKPEAYPTQTHAIELWDDQTYVATFVGTHQARILAHEMCEPLPTGHYCNAPDELSTIKSRSNGRFRLEDAPHFPLAYCQYPGIIENIESHLDCRGKYHFRLAFCNVASNEVKRTSRFTVSKHYEAMKIPKRDMFHDHDQGNALDDEHQHHNVALRKCVCTTNLYANTSRLQNRAREARHMFNYQIRLLPVKGIHIRATRQYANAEHMELIKATLANSQYTHSTYSDAWHYEVESITAVNYTARRRKDITSTPSVRGWKTLTMNIDDERWAEISREH